MAAESASNHSGTATCVFCVGTEATGYRRPRREVRFTPAIL